MATRTQYTAVVGNPITAAGRNDAGAGLIGYAKVTADQTGITTAVDLTNLTLTLTPVASRNLRIAFHVVIQITTASSGDVFNVSLLKDGTGIAYAAMPFPTATGIHTLTGFAIDVSPTAASHTYKLQGARQLGTGTYKVRGSATEVSTLTVEDVGVTF